LAWIAAKLVSSNSETRYASAASWRAITADDWKRKSVWEAIRPENYSDIKGTYLEILCNFTNKSLEGELADEELCWFLVPTDLTKSDGTGTETMRLLDTTSALSKCCEKSPDC
jgi:hypothetical protein